LTISVDHGKIVLGWEGVRVQEVAISEFKAKCLALLEQVNKTKKPIRVTRFGKPVAEVVPPSPSAEAGDWLGFMKGRMEILGDIVSPVMDENDWEALRD
jgi:prevent-host-death family protein